MSFVSVGLRFYSISLPSSSVIRLGPRRPPKKRRGGGAAARRRGREGATGAPCLGGDVIMAQPPAVTTVHPTKTLLGSATGRPREVMGPPRGDHGRSWGRHGEVTGRVRGLVRSRYGKGMDKLQGGQARRQGGHRRSRGHGEVTGRSRGGHGEATGLHRDWPVQSVYKVGVVLPGVSRQTM